MVDQAVQKDKVDIPPPTPVSNQRWYVMLIVAIVVSAGAGFFAGWQFGSHSEVRRGTNRQLQGDVQRGRFDMMRGGFGTVTEVSDSSITIHSQFPARQSQNSQETITYTVSSSTKVTNNGADANISDIKVGDMVRVQADNSESKAATSIEMNPRMRGGYDANTRDATPTGQGT